MKYNSIGEQLIAKAQELDPNYKPDKFNDMSEALDVILNNSGGGYKIKPLKITENGVYDSKFEAYKPVYVSVPQVTQDGSLKALLDGTKSTYHLFYRYAGTSIDGLIDYNSTANVTNMNEMFYYCSNLTTIPQLDTSSATTMSGMFQNCTSLTTISQLNTSKVKDMASMFKQCSNLITVPELDTSNVINMVSMFSYCTNLTSIPQLNASKATNLAFIFDNCTSLTSIGMYDFTDSIDITDTALEHDAIVALLNQAGIPVYSNERIIMGSAKLALLSDEEKAIATNKGWTLA